MQNVRQNTPNTEQTSTQLVNRIPDTEHKYKITYIYYYYYIFFAVFFSAKFNIFHLKVIDDDLRSFIK